MKHLATIRQADQSESQILTDLAMRSKAYWDYSVEFMEACRAELSVSPDDIRDPDIEYFLCELGGLIIGYYAIERVTEDQYELEALFVEPSYIGKGFGHLLMNHAKALLRQRKVKSLLVAGDPNAESFYITAGGIKIGTSESDSIPGRLLPEFRIDLSDANAA